MRNEKVLEEFRERFAGHVAIHKRLGAPAKGPLAGGALEALLWHKPGACNDWIRYYLHQGVLMATGDLYEGVYEWNDAGLTLAQIGAFNLDYFRGKCRASGSSCFDRPGWDWDADYAAAALDDRLANEVISQVEGDAADEWPEWVRDLDLPDDPDALYEGAGGPAPWLLEKVRAYREGDCDEDIAYAYQALDDPQQWYCFLEDATAADGLFEGHEFSDLLEIGCVPAFPVRCHWAGLRLAFHPQGVKR
jgi:hypothetical protein